VSKIGDEAPQSVGPSSRALDRLLCPRSIAVVGASESGLGGVIFANLQKDFEGTLYAVNPRRSVVNGVATYATVDDLPEATDLAIIVVASPLVADVAESAAAKGVGGALVVSAGFAEAGPEGKAAQDRLTALGRNGFPVLGPNCNGFMNAHMKVMANFIVPPDRPRPKPGPVAIVSQSGGFGGYLFIKAAESGLDVGWYVTSGNESDVNVSNVLTYLVERPEVQVLLTFHEAVRSPDDFVAAAHRATELGKSIVSLKAGFSEQGSRAALSHTASIVGSGAVYDAVCEQHGIVRARSIDELMDYGLVLQNGRRMAGNRIGILTVSGGSGVVMADAADETGLEVPEFPPDARAELDLFMPVPNYGTTANPVDTTGMFDQQNYGPLLAGIDRVSCVDATVPLLYGGGNAESIRDVFVATEKPMVAAVTSPEPLFSEAGLPSFPDPVRAIRALGVLNQRSRAFEEPAWPQGPATDYDRVDQARSLLRPLADVPFLLEDDAKKLFAMYRIPVSDERRVASASEAVSVAQRIGMPVALKILSYALPHKSDAGGLILGLRTDEDVRAAYEELVESATGRSVPVPVEGILVQKMLPADIEIALGIERDPSFGPIVAIALGGTLIELGPAPLLLHAPFTEDYAIERMKRLGNGKLVGFGRGLSLAQARTIARAAVSLGVMAIELPELMSADINPIRVSSTTIAAVDGLVSIAKLGQG
jgi:acyl-CoA synthetase (NDP forming)